MTEPGRIQAHAQAAGFGTVAAYATELEDILEHIVDANQTGPYTDPDDMQAALNRAAHLVESWERP